MAGAEEESHFLREGKPHIEIKTPPRRYRRGGVYLVFFSMDSVLLCCMFSGIVQSTAEVIGIEDCENVRVLRVRFPKSSVDGLAVGASVSVSGVCLTVTNISDGDVSFDVMAETIARTKMGRLMIGDWVNIERSLKYGDEIGGHLVSGHVHGVAKIISIEKNCFWFSTHPSLMKYIFGKGFIALDGCSLTVVDVDRIDATFSVCFIPETLSQTTFGKRSVQDLVNVEVDQTTKTMVDTGFII